MSDKNHDQNRELHNLAQRATFNETVEFFDQPLPHEIVGRLKEIVAAAEIQPGDAILDVGTGTGALIEHILPFKPGRIIGCDLSPKMLKRMGERFPQAERILGDVTDLTLPDAALDVVFMNAMFSNVADKPAALKNIARMLKGGGRVVVSHPEGRNFIIKLKPHVPFHLDPLPSEDEWREMLASHPLTPSYFLDAPRQYIAVAIRDKRS